MNFHADFVGQESRRQDHDKLLKDLAESVLLKNGISDDEIALMTTGQSYTNEPRLALAYYYCCGSHPVDFVFNDEHVCDSESVRERLLNALDSPPGATECSRCDATAAAADPSTSAISACASCCEFLVGPASGHLSLPLSRLPDTFRVSSEEYDTRYEHLSDDKAEKYARVFVSQDGIRYYLNPELIRDMEQIHLCSKCAYNPRKSKFSLANGHDYGRSADLPELNAVGKNCIAPARCFGLEFSLSAKHCSGHAICFPSSGPQSCAKVLPATDIDRKPRVTFIGPSEEWRAQRHRYRRLYELPAPSLFKWHSDLKETHSYFRKENIEIDESQAQVERLAELQGSIEHGVVVSDDAALHAVDDAVNSERLRDDATGDVGGESVLMQQSAVLQPAECQTDKVRSTIIEAMIDAVGIEKNVALVRRGVVPIVEWDENGHLIAGAFPTIFMMGGDMLPSGSFPQDLVKHLLCYYDGRFEDNVTLIATLFNQLQRHAAVRQAARAVTTHAKTLKKLASLASSSEFKESLAAARNDPESPAAKRLNAGLLRVLSVVGGTVPFSPFERAATRPKLAVTRLRFGLPHFWVTVAPPEQDDLTLHRIVLLRKLHMWNDAECKYGRANFEWGYLPENIKYSPRLRLSISNRCPALAALAFERKMNAVQTAILRCPVSQDTRVSRNCTQREAGAYGKVAGFNGVVEPQIDGRLHLHMTMHISTFTPEILTRGASDESLRQYIAQWMDAVCTNRLSPETRSWLEARGGSEPKTPLPRVWWSRC
jgi:hypothetical protein